MPADHVVSKGLGAVGRVLALPTAHRTTVYKKVDVNALLVGMHEEAFSSSAVSVAAETET